MSKPRKNSQDKENKGEKLVALENVRVKAFSFDVFLDFLYGVKGEFLKIVWPEKNVLFSIFVMVGVVSLITALFFTCSDYLSFKAINFLITNKI